MDPDQPPLALPMNTGPCPPFDTGVLEEDETSYIHYDTWGIKRRDLKHNESMSEFPEFPKQFTRCDFLAARESLY
jgi:hypothetical protein